MSQSKIQKHGGSADPGPDEDAGQVAQERKEALLKETDDLLDEIDDALESNAEQFVREYVQQGGQ